MTHDVVALLREERMEFDEGMKIDLEKAYDRT